MTALQNHGSDSIERQGQNFSQLLAHRVQVHFETFRRKTFLYDAKAMEMLEQKILLEVREVAKTVLALQSTMENVKEKETELRAQLQVLRKERDREMTQLTSALADATHCNNQHLLRVQLLEQFWEKEKTILKSQWEAEAVERHEKLIERFMQEGARREHTYLERIETEKRMEIEQLKRHYEFQKRSEIEITTSQVMRQYHAEVEEKFNARMTQMQHDISVKEHIIQRLKNELQRNMGVLSPRSVSHNL
jgi:hypothetical protein